jgi:hypothetical protein
MAAKPEMSVEKMRAEFEAWAIDESIRCGYTEESAPLILEKNFKGDSYSTVWVHGAWTGWQAALAAAPKSESVTVPSEWVEIVRRLIGATDHKAHGSALHDARALLAKQEPTP